MLFEASEVVGDVFFVVLEDVFQILYDGVDWEGLDLLEVEELQSF